MRLQEPSARSDTGFSLIEVMIAAVLLATSLAALAQLFALSVKSNAIARYGTCAAALAAQKVEQLRAERNLTPSGSNTLQSNTDGFVDYLDPNGSLISNQGSIIPDGTAYIRRWSIEAVPFSSAVLLQVLITRRPSRGAADTGAVNRAPEEARLITLARPMP